MRNYKFNRTILGIIMIVLALIVCFIVAPAANKLSSGKVDIIRVKKDVTQGSILTEEDIEITSVGSYNLPEDVIKDKSQIVGKYAACDLKANDYLFAEKLTASADRAEDVFKTLDGDKQAMCFTISSFAAGLSGKLQNGDIISILVTKANETTIPEELKYVRVITATTNTGNDADQAETSKSDAQPSTVTVLVNDLQAKLIANYEITGKIHVSLIYRGESETANTYLVKQDEILLRIKEQEESDVSEDISEEDISLEVNRDE